MAAEIAAVEEVATVVEQVAKWAGAVAMAELALNEVHQQPLEAWVAVAAAAAAVEV